MERYFKTQEGETVNIIQHTLEQIEKWAHLKIYIGTDSQDCHGRETDYVTCITYRYGQRGAHFIYFKETVPKVKDMTQFARLYDEGVRTIEVARILTDELPIAVEAMEFDFADEKPTLSSKLVGVFKGYQNSVFKGGEMIACKAADHILRHKDLYK